MPPMVVLVAPVYSSAFFLVQKETKKHPSKGWGPRASPFIGISLGILNSFGKRIKSYWGFTPDPLNSFEKESKLLGLQPAGM